MSLVFAKFWHKEMATKLSEVQNKSRKTVKEHFNNTENTKEGTDELAKWFFEKLLGCQFSKLILFVCNFYLS